MNLTDSTDLFASFFLSFSSISSLSAVCLQLAKRASREPRRATFTKVEDFRLHFLDSKGIDSFVLLLFPRHSLISLLVFGDNDRFHRPSASHFASPRRERVCGRRNSEFSVVCMRVTDYTRTANNPFEASISRLKSFTRFSGSNFIADRSQ